MKKQILSISLAAALAVSCTGIAMAEDKTPTVFVNQGQIFFDDQAPVILGEGTTLVPARGVFEAMGAKVEWKEDTRTVDVTSSDNKTLIRLTIDDSTMKVFDVSGVFGALMSGQDFVAPEMFNGTVKITQSTSQQLTLLQQTQAFLHCHFQLTS